MLSPMGMHSVDAMHQFESAIQAAGLVTPDVIEPDGEIHRFSSSGKRGDDAGWYVLHIDGIPSGHFGDWRTGVDQSWRSDIGRPLTPTEQSAHRARQDAIRHQRHAEEAQRHTDAARKAASLWKSASPAGNDHPYLVRKKVCPVATIREIETSVAAKILGYAPRSKGQFLTGRLLIVPVKIGNTLSTCELIDGDGRKSAIYGGAKSGGYWASQALPDHDGPEPLQIGEGVVTALSSMESNGHISTAALSSGNLSAVAKRMRELYPKRPLIILAELLRTSNEPDPHAVEAARSVAGFLAIPDFGKDRPDGATDFNDMIVLCGMDAVQKAIASAKSPSTSELLPEEIVTTGVESASATWLEPLPIPCSLLPVDAFSNDLLPASLRPWVTDIAERMQCPPDFPAVGAMVALSSVIGRKTCIRPKKFDDWQVIPNLWGAIVGRPGVMKSPALSEVMKPLDRLSSKARELHSALLRNHEIQSKLECMAGKTVEEQAQKLVKQGKKDEAEQLLIAATDATDVVSPVLRRYKVTDASVEALGEILIENPFGTLAYRDELNGLLRSLDKEGQEGARAFYLQGYDGNQSYTFDRITRGRDLEIPAVCIAMLGGIQPGKLQAYIHDAVRGGAGDDGLLQRFGLLVWPDINGEWRNVDRWPDTPARTDAFETFQRLDAIEPSIDSETGKHVPAEFHFSAEAQVLFEEWRHDFETALRSGEHHPAMESHLAKYRKLVPAIALVCALADGETDVSKTSLLRALAWAEYLQTHAAGLRGGNSCGNGRGNGPARQDQGHDSARWFPSSGRLSQRVVLSRHSGRYPRCGQDAL